MSRIFQLPRQSPIVGGVVSPAAEANFYLTLTTTRTNTYTDAALTTPSANPVIADAAGVFATIYLDPDIVYRLVLNDTAGALIYDEDPIQDALSQANLGLTFYPRSQAEIDTLVTPVNYFKYYGDLVRYGPNTTPGITDMAATLQLWATVGSQGVYLTLPDGVFLCDGEIDFTNGIHNISGSGTIRFSNATTNGLVFTECNNVEISGITLDANNLFCRLIHKKNCQNFHIHHNKFINGISGSGVFSNPLQSGSQDSFGHIISNNYFQGSTNAANVCQAIDMAVDYDPSPSADLTAYWKANSAVPATTYQNKECSISNNVIHGWRYGIQINGVLRSTITGNTTKDNVRGIVSNYSSNFNNISDNVIEEFSSTGVYLTFASSDNTISGNNLHTASGSSAAIYNILGSKRNHYIGNKLRSESAAPSLRFFAYAGVECDDVIFQDNDLRGTTSQAGICVESAWDDATTENSSRAWGESSDLTGFANNSMSGVIIKGNRIEMGSTPEHSIALLQINDAGTDYSLTNCIIEDNVVVGTTVSTNSKQLYLYEDTSGQLSGCRLLNNSFDPADTSASNITLPRGSDHFLAVSGNTLTNDLEDGLKSEIVVTTNVITVAESGKTFYLDLVGGFTSTLPAPAIGLNYTFIVTTAPTTAYFVTTTSGNNLLFGTLLDIVGELVYFSAQDVVRFVASTSLIGDRLEVESDGTNWYCKAFSGANGGITVAVT